jgi:hypothetical protein
VSRISREIRTDGDFYYALCCPNSDLQTIRYHTHPKYLPSPAKNVHLRGAAEEKYTVVDIPKQGEPARIIEEVEISRALFELYEGAVVSPFVHSFHNLELNAPSVHSSRTHIHRKYISLCMMWDGLILRRSNSSATIPKWLECFELMLVGLQLPGKSPPWNYRTLPPN